MNEPRPNTDEVQHVNLTMAIAELNLASGAQSLLEGKIRYNVEDWKPIVTNKNYSLTVSQGKLNATGQGLPRGGVVNVWDVRLGDFPKKVSLCAAAYEGTLDLNGLALQGLACLKRANTSFISGLTFLF